MQLVHFKIGFQFDETTSLHTPARKIFQTLSGKATKAKASEPGANLKFEKSKLEIIWRYERCRVSMEDTDDSKKCLSMVKGILERIDNAAPMGKLNNTEILTEWILPAKKHDFNSLNELYEKTMICTKEFMPGRYDSSVILDSRTGDFVLHHQSGPMMEEQLAKEYLVFKRPNLPKYMIFLIVGARYQKVIQYSKEEMNRFIEDAFDLCESHSNEFSKIWEGKL